MATTGREHLNEVLRSQSAAGQLPPEASLDHFVKLAAASSSAEASRATSACSTVPSIETIAGDKAPYVLARSAYVRDGTRVSLMINFADLGATNPCVCLIAGEDEKGSYLRG